MNKRILYLVGFGIVVVVVVSVKVFVMQPKVVAGQVYDCATKQPIAGVTVVAHQQGWGWDQYLVWDKDYSTRTQTDSSGNFRLDITHGDYANLTAVKDGYRQAFQNEVPGLTMKVGLLTGDNTKNSYNCIPEEECLATRQDGNVTVGWNKCTDPEPKLYK
jgi:hypothetical protein